MGQRDTVLRMLRDAYPDGVCANRFRRDDIRIHRAAARISELRAAGYDIRSPRCRRHSHDTPQIEYVLRAWEPFTITLEEST